MKKIYLYLAIIITLLFISGCENLYNDAYDSANPNVYVVGYERATTSYRNAIYWKNNEMHRLTNSSLDNVSIAKSVFVYDGKAFIAAIENGNAFYSIDGGNFNYLPDGVEANSVYVSDGDVYVAGSKYSGGFYYPMLWKNNAVLALPADTDTVANSVFVYNGDVYLAGTDKNSPLRAVNWINGTRTNLNGATPTVSNSIFVYKGDYYSAGYVTLVTIRACYWKNNPATKPDYNYTGESVAYSVFVYQGDIYVAGSVDNGSFDQSVYWKNGEIVYLSQNKSSANSIFVYNGDVYVAGWEEIGGKEIAKYWKNGDGIVLYNGTLHSRATSIFVSDE